MPRRSGPRARRIVQLPKRVRSVGADGFGRIGRTKTWAATLVEPLALTWWFSADLDGGRQVAAPGRLGPEGAKKCDEGHSRSVLDMLLLLPVERVILAVTDWREL
jgi:hypothetical protein